MLLFGWSLSYFFDALVNLSVVDEVDREEEDTKAGESKVEHPKSEPEELSAGGQQPKEDEHEEDTGEDAAADGEVDLGAESVQCEDDDQEGGGARGEHDFLARVEHAPLRRRGHI